MYARTLILIHERTQLKNERFEPHSHLPISATNQFSSKNPSLRADCISPKNPSLRADCISPLSDKSVGSQARVLAFTYKTTSLPRLVTPAKVPDMAAQLQGMFGIPLDFVSAKF